MKRLTLKAQGVIRVVKCIRCDSDAYVKPCALSKINGVKYTAHCGQCKSWYDLYIL